MNSYITFQSSASSLELTIVIEEETEGSDGPSLSINIDPATIDSSIENLTEQNFYYHVFNFFRGIAYDGDSESEANLFAAQWTESIREQIKQISVDISTDELSEWLDE